MQRRVQAIEEKKVRTSGRVAKGNERFKGVGHGRKECMAVPSPHSHGCIERPGRGGGLDPNPTRWWWPQPRRSGRSTPPTHQDGVFHSTHMAAGNPMHLTQGLVDNSEGDVPYGLQWTARVQQRRGQHHRLPFTGGGKLEAPGAEAIVSFPGPCSTKHKLT